MARSPHRSDRARSSRDERGTRRRSSSRGYHSRSQNDRSGHRRTDDGSHYRPSDRRAPPRDRSPVHDRDRKRHREASPVRDRHQERDRYDGRHDEPRDSRDGRDRYDRDRKRPRHSDSHRNDNSSRRGSHGAASGRLTPLRDLHGVTPGRLTPRSYDERSYQGSSPLDRSRPTSRGNQEQDEEAKKAARLARVQAMKMEADAKAAATKVEAPVSKPAVPKFASSFLKPSRPAYAGYEESTKVFDPKEISKRAAASLARQKSAGTSSASLRANIAQMEALSATTSVPGLTAEEDGGNKRKLEKLPAFTAVSADNNEDVDDDLIGSDDERDAAARDVAQKRALAAQQSLPGGQKQLPATTVDTIMKEDEDEADPLDAFMDNLERPEDSEIDYLRDLRGGKSRARRAFNSDDEDGDLDAIGMSLENLDTGPRKAKKPMPVINHAEMHYEEFRKKFYHESTELAELTDQEVDAIRAELDNITVSGKDIPKPIATFPQGGFGTQILDIINSLKFEKPTAIQAQALPSIMSGRDTLAVAKTGSGKTMAYLLPMFRHVKDQRPIQNLEGPIALIVVPTRELAVQVHKECKPFLASLNLRAALCYGGPPISEHIAELKRGAEIVVATPGRMIDLLTANGGRVTNLSRVTYLVLDEADRMFDMGFEKQVKVFNQNIRPDKQTVLFSATLPDSMEHFALRALKNPVQITVGGRSVVGDEIAQVVEVIEADKKFAHLLHWLGDNHKSDDGSRSLVFVERQESADQLHAQLLKKGYMVHSIHGGRDQADRDHFISEFKRGITDVLVATSVAARGLDVKQLNLVVNYDCPNHHEDYVHRCGRTGRAGNTGTAVTFITPEQNRYATFLVKALMESKRTVPPPLQELADSFQKKVETGELKEYTSGFGGHGIDRLQAERDSQRALVAKKYSADGEEVDAAKIEKKEDKKADGKDAQPDLRPEYERLLKEAMTVTKTEAPPPSTAKRGPINGKMTALERAAAAAASVNNRLGSKGATRPEVPVDNRGPDAGAFHAILKINDFPQEARWAVTQRQKVVKVLEATGVSITTKGIHYAAGKEPEPGDQPKLYCLIEGDTPTVVETAMHALCELVREGLKRHETETAAKAASGGRYSVVAQQQVMDGY